MFQSTILVVENVEKTVRENIGIFMNKLIQEMGTGKYLFVEFQRFGKNEKDLFQKFKDVGWHDANWNPTLSLIYFRTEWQVDEEPEYCVYRILEVPERLAWLVIDAIHLQRVVFELGHNQHDEIPVHIAEEYDHSSANDGGN